MDEGVRIQGRLYVAGTRGLSNYEIAVKNGFVGTEQEWLQSMFDYAAQGATNAVIEKINDGSFGIEFQTTYYDTTEELVLELAVVTIEEG